MNSSFSYLLQFLLNSGPTLIVAAVGLVLVLVNWQKLGRAALPAAGGLGLHLLASLSYPLVSAMLMEVATGGNSATTAMGFRILGLVNGVLHAAALALLVAALFTPRTPSQ